MRNEKGVLLVGVIVLMLVVAIIVPAMVLYVQNETRWSMKAARNMTAFQLAEAGIDKGMRKISESTTTWVNGQNGNFPAGFKWDTAYSDLGITGGSYAISITSGPEGEEVTIISIGRYKLSYSTEEVRAIHAVYANAPMGDTAVRGQSTVSIGGSNTSVHWGAVVSPQAITVNTSAGSEGKWPQYWSAAGITMDTDGPGGVNCDHPSQTAPPLAAGLGNCWQWHSYEQNIPPAPNFDPGFYQSSAAATLTEFTGNQTWGTGACSGSNRCCNVTDCDDGHVYYVGGNLNVTGQIYVKGTLFVTGNLSLPNGNAGLGSINTPLPKSAWLQYANSWATYTTKKDDDSPAVLWDTTPPPASFPGINAKYKPTPKNVQLDQVMVQGFLYVGGNLTQSGGAGQSVIVGALYVVGTVTVSPNNFFVYYSDEAGSQIKSTTVILSRKSWKDVLLQFPSGI